MSKENNDAYMECVCPYCKKKIPGTAKDLYNHVSSHFTSKDKPDKEQLEKKEE